jgi:hypothetical protein
MGCESAVFWGALSQYALLNSSENRYTVRVFSFNFAAGKTKTIIG